MNYETMNVPFEIDEIEDPNEDEIADGVILRNNENQENIDGKSSMKIFITINILNQIWK